MSLPNELIHEDVIYLIKIAPSILASDFSRLGEEIKKLEKSGADIIHIDVMDGHFVPNITIGPPVIKALRLSSMLLFDVHLMIENPDNYIDEFIDAGADIISVHAEACNHLNRTINNIKSKGKKAAVALNPATSLTTIEYIIDDVDMVLLLSVNPGFGGQVYIESVTEKIRQLRTMIKNRGLKTNIEVDGGIGIDNIYKVTEAGADIIVAGSSIFNSVNMADTIKQLKEKAYRV